MPEYLATEVPAYLREMQIILTAGLIDEAAKQTLTLRQVIRKMKTSGMVDTEIEKILFKDLHEGGQIFGDFRKQLKATVKNGLEDTGRNEVRQSYLDVKLWDWVGIADGKICDDCLSRNNMSAMSWEDWQAIGLPGTGATVCDRNCRCVLTPAESIQKEAGGLIRKK